jgi:hypothetical protein
MRNPIVNDDGIRYHLVTSFKCLECGSILKLSNSKPIKDTSRYINESYRDDVTGAAKVDNEVYVYPCEQCFGKLVKPLEGLKKVLGSL